MIIDYSIHRTDRVPTAFECWSAIVLALLIGFIGGMSVKHGADAFVCPWWTGGERTGMSADNWRRE